MNQLSDLINVAPRYARSVIWSARGSPMRQSRGMSLRLPLRNFCDGSGGLLPEPEATVPGH